MPRLASGADCGRRLVPLSGSPAKYICVVSSWKPSRLANRQVAVVLVDCPVCRISGRTAEGFEEFGVSDRRGGDFGYEIVCLSADIKYK